jgi:hypothetical protein
MHDEVTYVFALDTEDDEQFKRPATYYRGDHFTTPAAFYKRSLSVCR